MNKNKQIDRITSEKTELLAKLDKEKRDMNKLIEDIKQSKVQLLK